MGLNKLNHVHNTSSTTVSCWDTFYSSQCGMGMNIFPLEMSQERKMHNITFFFSFTVINTFSLHISFYSHWDEGREGCQGYAKTVHQQTCFAVLQTHSFSFLKCVCEREQSCPLARRLMCLLRNPGLIKQPNCPAVGRKPLEVLGSLTVCVFMLLFIGPVRILIFSTSKQSGVYCIAVDFTGLTT